MRRLLALLILLLLIQPAGHGQAQEPGITTWAEHTFGERISFFAKPASGAKFQEARLFYEIEGEVSTSSGIAVPSGSEEFRYDHDLQAQPLRAFATISYWFELVSTDGRVISSPKQEYVYSDNRYTWQSRSKSQFTVHWYAGDPAFAQSILDAAIQGLANSQNFLPLTLQHPVEIYTYASALEMRATLLGPGKNWAGAHADPDLGVILLSLPDGPEQRLEIERQVPHELMHVLLYQELGPAYLNLPVWLNEGIASAAELYPNPEYILPLEKALQDRSLLSIASLCREFPRNMSGVLLAYAESTSFTRYIHQQYGISGMQKLVQSYADGLECERGIEVALETPLTQIERQWRREALGENVALSVFFKLLPWITVMVAVLLVPISLSLAASRKKRPQRSTT